jgi:hypothetical protein
MRAVVVENFGAGSAGTGVGHLPEIVRSKRRSLVVADADDAFHRQADFIAPDGESLVVGVVDRGKQALSGKPPNPGQQFPGPENGVALEIIAERPIAKHLEEGVVARGVTDLVQIVVLATCAQAALHIDNSRAGRFFAAQKGILERHHARVGEHQGGVAGRHQ